MSAGTVSPLVPLTLGPSLKRVGLRLLPLTLGPSLNKVSLRLLPLVLGPNGCVPKSSSIAK